ncbi:NAD(P)/FAD-dependent oxidoreductase [Anaerobacillus sp. CMMVII]|uniref:NAD(P)/FAD-dependent oxidoreductase n=1 Tax=Anaerobacillus sp. CMMVII TaxID=2755588 RepID=UPI0021B746C5|nr:NAD(P)/FAD-dependent oxidoreductase [Anaerobacillus sp. CMMVII]MCT8138955.1 NAD(P)/FAD-dependent oxidoreductase [Anaerobacillus sp. CMMVII]
MDKPKIVILGSGYGGIITTKKLEKLLKSGEADVTLINKHSYHYITTQLHKIGAGTAQDNKIALPIEELIDIAKIKFKKATVSSLDFDQNQVLLDNGEAISYDYLVVALGFQVETFGIPGINEHAFKIRSFRSSKAIYHHIQKQFTMYQEDHDPARLTFAVAGAGFTGIEMVGELVEKLPKLAKHHNIPFDKIQIINIEASPNLLPGFEPSAVSYTTELLNKMGVKVMTSTKILECNENYVKVDSGEIATKTLIWSCGVRGHQLFEEAGLKTTRGKMEVDKFLRIPTLKNVFCVGDNALFMQDEKTPLPPTAQVALQQGPICAENIVAAIRGTELKPFHYRHQGSVASISDYFAVGKVGKFVIKGKFAAFMKQIIEAKYLFCLGGPTLIIKQLVTGPISSAKVTAKQGQ